MLGFGKKKDKDPDKNKKKTADKQDISETDKDSSGEKKSSENPAQKKSEDKIQDKATRSGKSRGKKKRPPVKLILIVFFILSIGVGAFAVYFLYFSPQSLSDQKATYEQTRLDHIDLPEEMLKFTFDHFPELYTLMVTANREINIIDKEVSRIENVIQSYPDQAKIAEKEKKQWVKTRDTLRKLFIKIEKPVKETYVLLQVNEPAGRAQIDELKPELSEAAQAALAPVQELTERIKSRETIPEGFIQKNIYKLKKKFL